VESGETGRAGANTPLDELIFLTSITCASDARQCRKGACARALQPSKTAFTQLARRVYSHSPASHSSARRSPGCQTNKSARSCRARAGAPCRMMSCKSSQLSARNSSNSKLAERRQGAQRFANKVHGPVRVRGPSRSGRISSSMPAFEEAGALKEQGASEQQEIDRCVCVALCAGVLTKWLAGGRQCRLQGRQAGGGSRPLRSRARRATQGRCAGSGRRGRERCRAQDHTGQAGKRHNAKQGNVPLEVEAASGGGRHVHASARAGPRERKQNCALHAHDASAILLTSSMTTGRASERARDRQRQTHALTCMHARAHTTRTRTRAHARAHTHTLTQRESATHRETERERVRARAS
jgi:hypothetical protein